MSNLGKEEKIRPSIPFIAAGEMDIHKGNQHPRYGEKTKKRRHGNGYFRSQERDRRIKSHIRIGSPWHHVWYFSEKVGHFRDHDIFPPKSYWKKIARRKVRRSRETISGNGYRKIFDLWILV